MARIDIAVPAGWSDLSRSQLLEVARVMDMALTREEALFVLACRLGGLRATRAEGGAVRFRDKEGRRFAMQGWQVADLCSRMEWALDTPPVDIVSPLGVDGHLNKVSFEDYFQADALMHRHAFTGDARFMRLALRLLGCRRRACRRTVRRAVATWWTGVQGYLKELYPNVYSGDGADEYDPRETFMNIMLILNDDHPQENEGICRTNVHFVLAALDDKIGKSKRIEDELRRRM